MPAVRIDLLRGRSRDERAAIADAVQEALVAELGVPERDRFPIVTEHDADGLRFDRGYLDRSRTDRFVLVRITLSAGRTTEAKRAFSARLAALLHERTGLDPDDLAVVLTENTREDRSFGGDPPPAQWR